MRHLLRFAVFSLVFSLILGPTLVGAQESPYPSNYWYRSNDFQDKINNLPSVPAQAVVIPILFGVDLKNISPNFGVPRSGGRSHAGEDIMATKGTPIISPTVAVVLRTGYGDSAGHYVYTANPGGETFVYMHLDKIGEGVTPGVELAQGSLIGYVGNTGNASGGAAHLHFEIHNSSGNPTDPFPRLAAELPVAEKITYLNTILAQTADSKALSEFLVLNFRSTFTSALDQGVMLPAMINSLLVSAGAGTVIGSNLDLEVGSTGAAVVALQTYLIQANSGAAAQKLKAAGATGTFGPATKAALVEFQLVKGISPASGYYGSVTRAYVNAHPFGAVSPVVSASVVTQPVISMSVVFTRDLRLGMTGSDIKQLQVLLNSKGFMVGSTGVGSPGKESTYFGAATQAAVKKFQIAQSIAPVNGNVGPLTRAALAK